MTDNAGTEIETAVRMIRLFCRARHGTKTSLCADCSVLLARVLERLRSCTRDPKPACRDCAAHCYPPPVRARIKEVMRFSGPRMLLLHPLLTLRHYLKRPSR